MRARILTVLALALAVVLHGSLARAQERVVLLSSDGTSEQWLATRAQLTEIGVDVAFAHAASSSLDTNVQRARELAGASPLLAVVWLEHRPDTVTVFFYMPRGPRLYSRRLTASGAPAAMQEEIAIVLRSAVSAALEGGELGMMEVALPRPAPARRERPRARREPAQETGLLRIATGYVGTLYALDSDWQHGAALSAALQPRSASWSAGARYTYLAPLTIQAAGTESEIRRHPGELFAGYAVALDPLWFVVEGAVIGDYVRRSTHDVSDSLSPAPDDSRWLWAVSTRLGSAVAVGRRGRLYFTVGAEFLLNRFDHVVRSEAGTSETVASPMPARPRVEVGGSIGLW